MRVRQVGNRSFAWECWDTGLSATGIRENVVMGQLDTLCVASGARGVAENVDIILSGILVSGRGAGLTLLHHVRVRVDLNVLFPSICEQSWRGIVQDDKCFDKDGKTFLFHVDNLLSVIRSAHQGRHLGLVKNVVDLQV